MLSGHIHLDGAGDLLWPRILLDHVDGERSLPRWRHGGRGHRPSATYGRAEGPLKIYARGSKDIYRSDEVNIHIWYTMYIYTGKMRRNPTSLPNGMWYDPGCLLRVPVWRRWFGL